MIFKKGGNKKNEGLLSILLLIAILLLSPSAILDVSATDPPTLIFPSNGYISTTDRQFTFFWTYNEIPFFPVDMCEIQVSLDISFASYEFTELSSSASYYNNHVLDDNIYFWRVRAHDDLIGWSDWCEPWSFTLAIEPPRSPVLNTPFENETTSDSTPELDWEISGTTYYGQYATSYDIQLSNSSQFTYLLLDTSAISTNYTIEAPLSDMTYWWRVRPIGFLGTVGEWELSNFTVDTENPNSPILQSPSISQQLTGEPVALTWEYVEGVKEYQVQVSNNEYFIPTIYNEVVDTYYFMTSNLSEGIYYWRVRSIDYANNVGNWSDIWYFKIDIEPPVINEVVFTPTHPTDLDEISIYCEIIEFGIVHYVKITYLYQEEWFVDYATHFMGNIYNFTIGPFEPYTNVTFYLTAVDEFARVTNSSSYLIDVFQSFTVAEYPLGVSSVLISLLSSLIILNVRRKQKRKKSISK